MSAQPMPQDVAAELSPEDAGRARLYGLLARIFRAGPDAALLRALAGSHGALDGDGALAQAWQQLCAAAGAADAHAETLEFDTVFVGVGKAPVSTYMSHYMSTARKEMLLADLRGELAGLGLARLATSVEPEDNLASLLEVMCHLVAAGSDAASLQRQREFCTRYLLPAYGGFVAAAQQARLSPYHDAAVGLLASFLDNERLQFDMV